MQVFELRSDSEYTVFGTKREAFARAIEMMEKGNTGRIVRLEFNPELTVKDLVVQMMNSGDSMSSDAALCTEHGEFEFTEDIEFMLVEARQRHRQMEKSSGQAAAGKATKKGKAKKKISKVAKKKSAKKKASTVSKKKGTAKKKSRVSDPGRKKKTSKKKVGSKKAAKKLKPPPPVPR